MAKDFKITNRFVGYRNKTDQTNIEPGVLVDGSQNVLFTDNERVAARQGYTLDGAENASLDPIEASFEFLTSRGVEIPLRASGSELTLRQTISTVTDTWFDFPDVFNAVDFNFDKYWSTAEAMDLLLFVNGDSTVFEWSGGMTTLSAPTANTIKKEGSTTWAEDGFLTAGTRQVVIDGSTYTYTGGESTTILTGVTPDPSVIGHLAGSLIVQAVRSNANSTITSLPNALENDLIKVLDNQVYIASQTRSDVYVSKVNNFLDFSFSSPRTPGEGALLTLNGNIVAFVPQEEFMYISAGTNQWYQTELRLSADLTNEELLIRRLKSGVQEGALSQGAVSNVKNQVLFLSNEVTLDTLGRVENIDTPQSKPISDPIKNDFNSFDFTNAHVKYFRNNLYVAVPNEGKVLIYNIEQGFWEAPQVLPVRRFAIIDNELYGHSNSVPETYKLFDGFRDRDVGGVGNPIDCIAAFSYQSYKKRGSLKNLTEWFTEGYIESNTMLTLQLNYDFTGSTQIQTFDINGADSSILFNLVADGSFGKLSLGKAPLGGGGLGDAIPKFRVIDVTPKQDFYEVQAVYKSNDVDQRWELLAFGGNVSMSNADNNSIKQ